MIRILVEFEFIPEHTEEAKKLIKELAIKSAQEKGCVMYHALESLNDENSVILYESFADKEAQDFHKTTSHYKEILQEKLPSLIKERKVRFLEIL